MLSVEQIRACVYPLFDIDVCLKSAPEIVSSAIAHRAGQGRPGQDSTVCANSLHTPSYPPPPPSCPLVDWPAQFTVNVLACACEPTIFSNLIQLVVVFYAIQEKVVGAGRGGDRGVR